MPTDIETAVADGVDDLLDTFGSSFTYSRGRVSGSVVLAKQNVRTQYADGNGQMISAQTTDFKGRPTDLPKEVEEGDIITDGVTQWEVGFELSDVITSTMIRIHAKEIK